MDLVLGFYWEIDKKKPLIKVYYSIDFPTNDIISFFFSISQQNPNQMGILKKSSYLR